MFFTLSKTNTYFLAPHKTPNLPHNPDFQTHFFRGTDILSLCGSNPYMSEKDIYKFAKEEACCICLKHDDLIIATAVFVCGKFYCDELRTVLDIGTANFYITRVFVEKSYRGNNLVKIMIENIINNFDVKYLWCFIYDWNTSSERAFIKTGFNKKFCFYTFKCNAYSLYLPFKVIINHLILRQLKKDKKSHVFIL